jgi:hypothetical protein
VSVEGSVREASHLRRKVRQGVHDGRRHGFPWTGKYDPAAMRIELRDTSNRRISRVDVDERVRPARVDVPGREQGLFPRWDGAIDDAGSLRRCVVCGCESLYVRRNFPQVTPVIVVLAFSGAVVAILGYAAHPVATAALIVLLIADLLILRLSTRWLVCYRCGAIFTGVRISRFHGNWDRSVAEKVAAEPMEMPTVLAPSDGSSDAQPDAKEEPLGQTSEIATGPDRTEARGAASTRPVDAP